MFLKKIIRRSIGYLPESVRFNILRRFVRVQYSLPPQLAFKIADNREELEAAFRLLHDSYVGVGLMSPHPSGMRVTPYHALPNTTTLVALLGKEVIATVSIIRDSHFGVPSDKIFDLSELRKRCNVIAEISSLAVAPAFRRNHGEVLLAMTRFLSEYCYDYFGVDCLLASVNPRHEDFYRALLCFDRLSKQDVAEYDFVNGAPAVGVFMDLKIAESKLLENYLNAPAHRNIWAYYFQASVPRQFRFPDRSFLKLNDPVMSPADLSYFFCEKTKLFQEMDSNSRALLRRLYFGFPNYRDLIPESSVVLGSTMDARRNPRFDVSCGAVIRAKGVRTSISATVLNVSLHGFTAILSQPIPPGTSVEAHVRLGSVIHVMIKARTVWSGSQVRCGFELVEASREWTRFIDHLSQDIDKGSVA